MTVVGRLALVFSDGDGSVGRTELLDERAAREAREAIDRWLGDRPDPVPPVAPDVGHRVEQPEPCDEPITGGCMADTGGEWFDASEVVPADYSVVKTDAGLRRFGHLTSSWRTVIGTGERVDAPLRWRWLHDTPAPYRRTRPTPA